MNHDAMNYDVELGKLFKDRENQDVDEAIIGDIIKTNPITVSLFNGQAIYTDGVNCYVCESLKSIKGTIILDNIADHGTITTGFTITRDLNIGDEVVCIPTANGQKYIIVEKVDKNI